MIFHFRISQSLLVYTYLLDSLFYTHTHSHTLFSEKEEVPESYNTNSKKEKLLLAFADNFQRQFRQLYGDRKTLLLKPTNECGVEVLEGCYDTLNENGVIPVIFL